MAFGSKTREAAIESCFGSKIVKNPPFPLKIGPFLGVFVYH
jgi:hypothetical protein